MKLSTQQFLKSLVENLRITWITVAIMSLISAVCYQTLLYWLSHTSLVEVINTSAWAFLLCTALMGSTVMSILEGAKKNYTMTPLAWTMTAFFFGLIIFASFYPPITYSIGIISRIALSFLMSACAG